MPSESRRGKPSFLSSIIGQLQLMHYRYEVNFSAYVLTSGEKFFLNTIVIALLTLLLVGIVSCLPQLLLRAAVRLFWLYNRCDDQLTVNNTTSAWEEVESGIYHWTYVIFNIHSRIRSISASQVTAIIKH
jgi:hypothetical protein